VCHERFVLLHNRRAIKAGAVDVGVPGIKVLVLGLTAAELVLNKIPRQFEELYAVFG